MSLPDRTSLNPRQEPTPFPVQAGTRPDVENPDATVVGKGLIYPGSEAVPGYRLVRKLGKGGFGEVWEAKGPGGFAVALKFVHLQGHAASMEVRSLDLMKALRHPNLLCLWGAWERHGYLIVAMELAEGTIYDHMKKAVAQGQPGIPMGELLEVLYEAAKGIDFLNEPRHCLGDGSPPIGIQHRDIKPQNILMLGGSAKVADFGLAKLLESTVCASSGSMSPAYSAPEFSQGKTTRWSDQYSLAVSYCQLRGNRLPFTGTLAQILTGHLSLPPDLSMIPHEPERQVVARALAKRPDKRWPTCRLFIEALFECFVQQNPADAHKVKFPTSTGSSVRSPPKPPLLLELTEIDSLSDTAGVPMPPPPRRADHKTRPQADIQPPPLPAALRQVKVTASAPESASAEEPRSDPNRVSSLILLAAVLIIVAFMTFVLVFVKSQMEGSVPLEPDRKHLWTGISSPSSPPL